MNAHQRRKNLVKRHMEFPLGSHVIWFTPYHGPVIGTVSKHWTHSSTIRHDHPGLVASGSRAPYRALVLLDVHRRGERPWWRVTFSQVDPSGKNRKHFQRLVRDEVKSAHATGRSYIKFSVRHLITKVGPKVETWKQLLSSTSTTPLYLAPSDSLNASCNQSILRVSRVGKNTSPDSKRNAIVIG